MKKTKKLFKIYVLGNPLVEEDSLPIQLLPNLREGFREVEFVEIDPTENFPEEDNLIIIDTVINTDRVRILKDVSKIESQPNYSLHDFDLGFNLKLMKKLGKVKEVNIIGVPPNYNEKEALREIKEIIPSLLSKSE